MILESDVRYERKFIYKKNNNLVLINNLLNSKNFAFTPLFNERNVNSIYYDTKDLFSIKENLDGVSHKTKYRLRWYGSIDCIKNPSFEIKKKIGYLNYKQVTPIDNFSNLDLKNLKNFKKIDDLFNKKIKISKMIRPKILVSYSRKYFVSKDKIFRATVDYDLKCKKYNFFGRNLTVNENSFNTVILELKYKSKFDTLFRKIVSFDCMRFNKFSKYVYCYLNTF